jgi:hypothetical protein
MPNTAELVPKTKHLQVYSSTTRADQPQPAPRMAPLVQLLEPLTGRVRMDLGRGHSAVTKQPLAREPLAQGTAS